MPSVIKLPRMSDTMEEGQLVRWLKEEGAEVAAGEAIAEVETDKATLELESYEDGYLVKRLVEAGSAVKIGAPVAILAEEPDADVSGLLEGGDGGSKPAAKAEAPKAAPKGEAPKAEPAPKAEAPKTAPKAEAPKTAPKAEPASKADAPRDGRIKASPLAKKMARELELDIAAVAGSGPGGRIIARDVEEAARAPAAAPETRPAAAAAPVAAEGEARPLSPMRKTIARRMVEAKQAVPHFYLTMDIDMGPAADFRAQLNAAGSTKVSFNDLIVKACALALIEHPWVNASYAGDEVIFHKDAHVGIAVALDGGLITPVVRNAQGKSIGQIAREARELATRAQEKKLKPEEYQGGTFSVSNLGMFGIREFVAIIDPPQAAILAVGAVQDVPVVKDGQLAIGKRMAVTLSCDHRVVDGATGAQFLGTVKRILENPLQLVL